MCKNSVRSLENRGEVMKNILVLAVVFVIMPFAHAGMGGIVVKGAFKTWDAVAKSALKATGKAATDDAVKAAAKTLEEASSRYGDDVAKRAMRIGVEVAELSLRHEGRFVAFLKASRACSDDAVRKLVLNADEAVKYAAKYGDDVVRLGVKAPGVFTHGIALVEKSGVKNVGATIGSIAENLPAEQIPQVFGAVRRNPTVAREFLDAVSRGGSRFVDKVFELHGKQILAGTLGASAIVATVRVTAPAMAEGRAIDARTETATNLITGGNGLTDDQRRFVLDWSKATSWTRMTSASLLIGLAFLSGAALVFVIRKHRR